VWKSLFIKQNQQHIRRALRRLDLEARRRSGVADVEFRGHLPWWLGQRQYGAIWFGGQHRQLAPLAKSLGVTIGVGNTIGTLDDPIEAAEARRVTTVTRLGCWINVIPAGGLVLIPEASSGCTCPYALQTTMALAPPWGWFGILGGMNHEPYAQQILAALSRTPATLPPLQIDESRRNNAGRCMTTLVCHRLAQS
jgi:hypothetical protein